MTGSEYTMEHGNFLKIGNFKIGVVNCIEDLRQSLQDLQTMAFPARHFRYQYHRLIREFFIDIQRSIGVVGQNET